MKPIRRLQPGENLRLLWLLRAIREALYDERRS